MISAFRILAIACLIMLGGCGELSGDSFRFKMTVEVETPEGLRTGSSVMQVTGWLPTATLPESHGFELKLKGEAVAVDLPGGKTLFALLKTRDTIEGTALWVFHPEARGHPDRMMAAVRDLGRASSNGRRAALAPDKYPMLVTFADARDPKSVMLIDPNDLAARFSAGTRLRRITVQITDDPVTKGVVKRLGWLPQFYDKMLDGSPLNNSNKLANSLSMTDFLQRN